MKKSFNLLKEDTKTSSSFFSNPSIAVLTISLWNFSCNLYANLPFLVSLIRTTLLSSSILFLSTYSFLINLFIAVVNVPTVIFDEIDTGISGRIAHCVGEKMYEIAVKHQVFCITHLPQIACFSDNHYLVKKTFKNEKTYSNISRLNESQKINEVAKMLGGTKMLHSSLENAKSMIEYANDRKKEICSKYTKGIDK